MHLAPMFVEMMACIFQFPRKQALQQLSWECIESIQQSETFTHHVTSKNHYGYLMDTIYGKSDFLTHEKRVFLEFFSLILSFHFFFLHPVCLSHLEGPIILSPLQSAHLHRTLQDVMFSSQYAAAEKLYFNKVALTDAVLEDTLLLCDSKPR